jgi:hypothetical protein
MTGQSWGMTGLHGLQAFHEDVVDVTPYAHRPHVLPQIIRQQVSQPEEHLGGLALGLPAKNVDQAAMAKKVKAERWSDCQNR